MVAGADACAPAVRLKFPWYPFAQSHAFCSSPLASPCQPAVVIAQQITPVAAQPSVSAEDRAACLDGPFDDNVAVCTRLIESGQV